MKLMGDACYRTYTTILRALRGRGERVGFLAMSNAAELALLLEEDPAGEATTKLAAKLELDMEELDEARQE